jgi:hypothetical protein
LEKRVEVDGREHVVKVIDGGAEFDVGRSGKKLLRIRITAEVGRVDGEHTIVDCVVREYTITYSRRGRNNAAEGYAVARADAPDGREVDAERLVAVIKALTGVKPRIRRIKDGGIMIVCYREHLDGFNVLRRARRHHREMARGDGPMRAKAPVDRQGVDDHVVDEGDHVAEELTRNRLGGLRQSEDVHLAH